MNKIEDDFLIITINNIYYYIYGYYYKSHYVYTYSLKHTYYQIIYEIEGEDF